MDNSINVLALLRAARQKQPNKISIADVVSDELSSFGTRYGDLCLLGKASPATTSATTMTSVTNNNDARVNTDVREKNAGTQNINGSPNTQPHHHHGGDSEAFAVTIHRIDTAIADIATLTETLQEEVMIPLRSILLTCVSNTGEYKQFLLNVVDAAREKWRERQRNIQIRAIIAAGGTAEDYGGGRAAEGGEEEEESSDNEDISDKKKKNSKNKKGKKKDDAHSAFDSASLPPLPGDDEATYRALRHDVWVMPVAVCLEATENAMKQVLQRIAALAPVCWAAAEWSKKNSISSSSSSSNATKQQSGEMSRQYHHHLHSPNGVVVDAIGLSLRQHPTHLYVGVNSSATANSNDCGVSDASSSPSAGPNSTPAPRDILKEKQAVLSALTETLLIQWSRIAAFLLQMGMLLGDPNHSVLASMVSEGLIGVLESEINNSNAVAEKENRAKERERQRKARERAKKKRRAKRRQRRSTEQEEEEKEGEKKKLATVEGVNPTNGQQSSAAASASHPSPSDNDDDDEEDEEDRYDNEEGIGGTNMKSNLASSFPHTTTSAGGRNTNNSNNSNNPIASALKKNRTTGNGTHNYSATGINKWGCFGIGNIGIDGIDLDCESTSKLLFLFDDNDDDEDEEEDSDAEKVGDEDDGASSPLGDALGQSGRKSAFADNNEAASGDGATSEASSGGGDATKDEDEEDERRSNKAATAPAPDSTNNTNLKHMAAAIFNVKHPAVVALCRRSAASAAAAAAEEAAVEEYNTRKEEEFYENNPHLIGKGAPAHLSGVPSSLLTPRGTIGGGGAVSTPRRVSGGPAAAPPHYIFPAAAYGPARKQHREPSVAVPAPTFLPAPSLLSYLGKAGFGTHISNLVFQLCNAFLRGLAVAAPHFHYKSSNNFRARLLVAPTPSASAATSHPLASAGASPSAPPLEAQGTAVFFTAQMVAEYSGNGRGGGGGNGIEGAASNNNINGAPIIDDHTRPFIDMLRSTIYTTRRDHHHHNHHHININANNNNNHSNGGESGDGGTLSATSNNGSPTSEGGEAANSASAADNGTSASPVTATTAAELVAPTALFTAAHSLFCTAMGIVTGMLREDATTTVGLSFCPATGPLRYYYPRGGWSSGGGAGDDDEGIDDDFPLVEKAGGGGGRSSNGGGTATAFATSEFVWDGDFSKYRKIAGVGSRRNSNSRRRSGVKRIGDDSDGGGSGSDGNSSSMSEKQKKLLQQKGKGSAATSAAAAAATDERNPNYFESKAFHIARARRWLFGGTQRSEAQFLQLMEDQQVSQEMASACNDTIHKYQRGLHLTRQLVGEKGSGGTFNVAGGDGTSGCGGVSVGVAAVGGIGVGVSVSNTFRGVVNGADDGAAIAPNSPPPPPPYGSPTPTDGRTHSPTNSARNGGAPTVSRFNNSGGGGSGNVAFFTGDVITSGGTSAAGAPSAGAAVTALNASGTLLLPVNLSLHNSPFLTPEPGAGAANGVTSNAMPIAAAVLPHIAAAPYNSLSCSVPINVPAMVSVIRRLRAFAVGDSPHRYTLRDHGKEALKRHEREREGQKSVSVGTTKNEANERGKEQQHQQPTGACNDDVYQRLFPLLTTFRRTVTALNAIPRTAADDGTHQAADILIATHGALTALHSHICDALTPLLTLAALPDLWGAKWGAHSKYFGGRAPTHSIVYFFTLLTKACAEIVAIGHNERTAMRRRLAQEGLSDGFSAAAPPPFASKNAGNEDYDDDENHDDSDDEADAGGIYEAHQLLAMLLASIGKRLFLAEALASATQGPAAVTKTRTDQLVGDGMTIIKYCRLLRGIGVPSDDETSSCKSFSSVFSSLSDPSTTDPSPADVALDDRCFSRRSRATFAWWNSLVEVTHRLGSRNKQIWSVFNEKDQQQQSGGNRGRGGGEGRLPTPALLQMSGSRASADEEAALVTLLTSLSLRTTDLPTLLGEANLMAASPAESEKLTAASISAFEGGDEGAAETFLNEFWFTGVPKSTKKNQTSTTNSDRLISTNPPTNALVITVKRRCMQWEQFLRVALIKERFGFDPAIDGLSVAIIKAPSQGTDPQSTDNSSAFSPAAVASASASYQLVRNNDKSSEGCCWGYSLATVADMTKLMQFGNRRFILNSLEPKSGTKNKGSSKASLPTAGQTLWPLPKLDAVIAAVPPLPYLREVLIRRHLLASRPLAGILRPAHQHGISSGAQEKKVSSSSSSSRLRIALSVGEANSLKSQDGGYIARVHDISFVEAIVRSRWEVSDEVSLGRLDDDEVAELKRHLEAFAAAGIRIR